ncbi:MAG: GTPase HflX [Candidatus Omnitrophica bacterium]|nr:GTPase HflX [Candidatus Omnitrophota bacterium]
MEKALLVTIDFKQGKDSINLEDSAIELEELAAACRLEVVDNITCLCQKPTPNLLMGRGKVEEIGVTAQELGVEVIVLSHNLSGTQQRNLEDIWGKKTVDRTQLILDIFARRAKSPEGKMQVELAQLEYLIPRLVGKGIVLSRQGGGVGTSGPGERKLEVDRRRIKSRIDRLKADLKAASVHRSLVRKRRKNEEITLVALVGYTSAGKSTLLNVLTEASQPVSENVFTTLDPLARSLRLPKGEQIILSDTVGFLRDLPHDLIEAFKGTLEEVTNADLLIHVLDVSSPQVYDRHKAVMGVLKELRADDKPMITALNKIDLLNEQAWLETVYEDFVNPIVISAKLHKNLGLLLEKIQEIIPSRMISLDAIIPHRRMDLVDLFYREGKVEKIRYLQKGIEIKAIIPRILHEQLVANKIIACNC